MSNGDKIKSGGFNESRKKFLENSEFFENLVTDCQNYSKKSEKIGQNSKKIKEFAKEDIQAWAKQFTEKYKDET